MELRPVTAQNWKELIKLKVSEDQTHFVASNLYSIAEAQFGFEDEGHWDFYPFGAYVEDEPVGFVMYCFNFNHSRFQAFIMRLMVDQRFQGRGRGREIMQLVLDDFRQDERIKNVGISYEPENITAQKLYASLGFVEPGEMLEGENPGGVEHALNVVKYCPLANDSHGACSSMAERHTVDVDVVGSKPIRHPM